MGTWTRVGMGASVLGAVAGASTYAGRQLLAHQAGIARRRIGKPLGEDAIDADRIWKRRYGDPIDMCILGDSVAAGLGAETRKQTLGGRLAKGVAKHTHRAVRLRTTARVGSLSAMLADQVADLPVGYRPDVAVIVVGGNDVTHRVPIAESTRHLAETILAMRDRGAEVVVGTCPDFGALRPVPQPLRTLGSRASRQLADAQREVALASGAWVVSLGDVVGRFFITNPDEMFSLDRFHPSADGYQRTAVAMLPSVLAALGHTDDVPDGHHLPWTHR